MVRAAARVDGCPHRLRGVVLLLVVVLLALPAGLLHPTRDPASSALRSSAVDGPTSNSSPVANFSASIDRLVDLLGIAGSGLLALVWARVALSWFSHDVTKKVQAKERARDALIGSLLFVAALTGLIWGLAHWVLTGT